jgi:plasmid stabilization system protein ParE
MTGITWSEPALEDMKALRGWIGRDSKPLADRVVERIFDAIEQVIPFPRIGRVVSEVGDESVRELLFRTFRIVYHAGADGIVVLGVLHGGRPSDRREPRRWEVY